MDYNISEKVKYLHKVLCETDKIYNSLLNKMQITDSEYTLLFAILTMGEGCLQKDIADSCLISKKTLNSTVKKLEKKGILKLKPGKYPNLHIYLTPEGKSYIEERLVPIMQEEDDILDTVSGKDFDAFISITTKYLKLFERH
ncbi:MarR family transcriptional regulator [bacterium]|nr:MarR family transcriptional regulator [bacterium]